MVDLANDIGVTISKQDLSVLHRLRSMYPGSRRMSAKFVRRETKICFMTQKRKPNIAYKRNDKSDDVTLLRTNLARAARQLSDVKFVMFIEKVVLKMPIDEKLLSENSFDLRKCSIEFDDSVCNKLRRFR